MITVLGMRDAAPADATVVDTTSRSKTWSRQLSPFFLGPCELWGGHVSLNMENAWQYSKVYSGHIRLAAPRLDPRTSAFAQLLEPVLELNESWLEWAKEGWANQRAVRYPMGKDGVPPLFSYWDGMRFDYVEARCKIYVPLYWQAVRKRNAWSLLVALARAVSHLVLRDFDGYDHRALGMSLLDVLNSPGRKMGHAFVLAMMLKEMGIE